MRIIKLDDYIYSSIAQSETRWTSNGGGFDPHCGKKLSMVAVADREDANSRLLGLVSVMAARSLDQTALRPSVIKRLRQMT